MDGLAATDTKVQSAGLKQTSKSYPAVLAGPVMLQTLRSPSAVSFGTSVLGLAASQTKVLARYGD